MTSHPVGSTQGYRLAARHARLGAGLALTLLAGAAEAKTLSAMAPRTADATKSAKSSIDDGLAGGGFFLEADTLTRNEDTHHVVASGGVEARYKGRVLRAEHVDYDTQTGVVIASGSVSVLQPDGTTQFADTISLDKTMSEGFAKGFSARMQGHVKIAAESADHKSKDITEFHHVIYTPCLTCEENDQRPPTWSIRAASVIEDKAHERLVFKGAVVEVLGQGIFYLPIMQTANPAADRKTGFLLPLVTFSGPRGATYEQPYYMAISTSQDLLVTPQFNTAVNPFLKVDWRKRFYSGSVEVRGGYTYDSEFNSSGNKFGVQTSRSYILANGAFQLSPHWEWGFTAERTSDKLIFDKYAVADVYTNSQNVDRGLYAVDDRRLISQLYTVRQDALSYLSVAAISVQGLRVSDDQSAFPTIAPLIEGRWEAPGAVLGGRLRVDGSGVVLSRDQALSTTDATGQTVGTKMDSRRATLQADWQRTFTLNNGLRLQPFVDGRGDVYDLVNAPANRANATVTRAFGTIGADISYPLVRRAVGATYILEPMAQLAIAPNTRQDARIPNEDSVDFDFSDTNLLKANRSPGFDLYQAGQAATLAGRATVILDDGRSASLFAGRRLAAQSTPSVPAYSGLQPALSDWIFSADANPIKGVRLFSRLRLDGGTFAVNRLTAGASFSTARAEGYVSYLQEARSPAGAQVNSLDLHGAFFVTRHWGATSYMIIDGGAWRRRELGVVYRDDCLRVEVVYRHDETFNGTLGPSTSVLLRLTLATLGNTR